MTIHVRAPATTANLGAGFDIAGAALELWNELEVGEADGEVDGTHLGVRAFARYASPAAYSFTFTDRIPRERSPANPGADERNGDEGMARAVDTRRALWTCLGSTESG